MLNSSKRKKCVKNKKSMYVRKNVYRMKHVHHVFFLNVTYQKSAPSIWTKIIANITGVIFVLGTSEPCNNLNV